jgi:hypothetical protein
LAESTIDTLEFGCFGRFNPPAFIHALCRMGCATEISYRGPSIGRHNDDKLRTTSLSSPSTKSRRREHPRQRQGSLFRVAIDKTKPIDRVSE